VVNITPTSTDEDTPVVVTPTIIDADIGDQHVLSIVANPAHGTITFNNLGRVPSFEYTPDLNWNGIETFELKACDMAGACATMTASIKVSPVNDPPSDSTITFITKKNMQSEWVEPVTLDPDQNQVFHYNLLSPGDSLLVSIDYSGAYISVSPKQGYVGITTFTYEACDQNNACISATGEVEVLEEIGHTNGINGKAEIPIVTGGFPLAKEGNYPVTSDVVIKVLGTRELLSGQHDLSINWQTSAPVNIDILGNTIAPSSSITLLGYDFDANHHKVVLPAAITDLAADGITGTLTIKVLDSSGIEYSNVPTIRIDVSPWDIANEIQMRTVGTVKPDGTVAKMIEEATVLPIQTGLTHNCQTNILGWHPEMAGNYAGMYGCAIRWSVLPEGMQHADSATSPVISGRFANPARPDSESIYWSMGLIQDTNGQVQYLPSVTPEQEYIVGLYEPEVPSLAFNPTSELSKVTTWVPTGQWPAKIGANKRLGALLGQAKHEGLLLDITKEGNTETFPTTQKQISKHLFSNLTGVTDAESISAKISYLHDDTLFSALDMTFVAIPEKPMIMLNPVRSVMSGETVEISGKVGQYDPELREIVYDSIKYGHWNVRLFRKNINQAQPDELLAGPYQIDLTNGGFTMPVMFSENEKRIRLYAQATLLNEDGSENIAATVTTTTVNVVVHNTSPIEASAEIRRNIGSAPFNALPYVHLINRNRYVDVGEIIWEESTDGVTFNRVPDTLPLAWRIVRILSDSTERWYRAILVNKHSQKTFTTNTVHVQSYVVPNVSIKGFQKTFIGHPVTWTANSDITPVIYTWEVRQGTMYGDPIRTETGNSITFSAEEIGRYYITLRTAPQNSTNIEASIRVITKPLEIRAPYLRRPSIVGPYFTEVGNTYSYQAINADIIQGSQTDLQLNGEWVLPNGMIVPGDQLDYTVQTGDSKLIYRAWIEGYKAETQKTVEKRIYAWTYEWPTSWKMTTRTSTFIAPVRVTLYTKTDPSADIRKMGLVKPAYTYTIPQGVSVLYEAAGKLVVDIATPGVYPIEVLIEDDRGNQELAMIDITAIDPPPLETNLTVNIADRWSRAPSRVLGRIWVTNPISGESVAEHVVRLDGVEISRSTGVTIDIPEVSDAGTHELMSELTMSSGRHAIATQAFTMVEGDLPSCGLSFNVYATYTYGILRCALGMGSVKSIDWYATFDDNGGAEEKLAVTGYRGLFRQTIMNRGIGNIRIVVTNDKGQKMEVNEPFPQ
jgi:hypothetical protein